jgi:hypothetical protein
LLAPAWRSLTGKQEFYHAHPRSKGAAEEDSHPRGSQPERISLAEVIAEADALRALLSDAAGRAARLLAALKQERRQNRAVHQAMQSLRQLQIDP